jgi:hypothetical protein
MKTSLEIAQEAELVPIEMIAESCGLEPDEIEPYGRYKAKISLDVWPHNTRARSNLSLHGVAQSIDSTSAVCRASLPSRAEPCWAPGFLCRAAGVGGRHFLHHVVDTWKCGYRRWWELIEMWPP